MPRVIIQQGLLDVRPLSAVLDTAWKVRYFLLDETHFYYFRNAPPAKLQIKRQIPLIGTRIVADPAPGSTCFTVQRPNLALHLRAKSGDERDIWVAALEGAIGNTSEKVTTVAHTTEKIPVSKPQATPAATAPKEEVPAVDLIDLGGDEDQPGPSAGEPEKPKPSDGVEVDLLGDPIKPQEDLMSMQPTNLEMELLMAPSEVFDGHIHMLNQNRWAVARSSSGLPQLRQIEQQLELARQLGAKYDTMIKGSPTDKPEAEAAFKEFGSKIRTVEASVAGSMTAAPPPAIVAEARRAAQGEIKQQCTKVEAAIQFWRMSATPSSGVDPFAGLK